MIDVEATFEYGSPTLYFADGFLPFRVFDPVGDLSAIFANIILKLFTLFALIIGEFLWVGKCDFCRRRARLKFTLFCFA